MVKQKKQYLKSAVRVSLVCILLCWAVFYCWGQKYLVRSYTASDGLPHTSVQDVVQDHSGRMWFATRGGVTCYDGSSWNTYMPAEGPGGLPFLSVFRLQVDREGRIWGLPYSNPSETYLVYYDGRQWHTFHKKWSRRPDTLYFTSFQLLHHPPGDDDKPVAAIGTTHGLVLWNRGQWILLDVNKGLPGNHVSGIASLNGKFYVATHNGLAVIRIDPARGVQIENRPDQLPRLPTPRVRAIAVQYKDKFPHNPGHHSRIWLLGEKWIGRFDENSTRITHYPTPFTFDIREGVVTIMPDYHGGLYISASRAFRYFNIKTRSWERLSVSNGLVSNINYSIYTDFEKNVWVSGGRGITKIASRRFSNYYAENGMLEDEVTAVLEYEPGKFILGHDKGVTFWDKKEFQHLPLAGEIQGDPAFSRVLGLKQGPGRNIWAALDGGGLIKIDPDRQVTWYGEPHGLPSRILSLRFDPTGSLWVGTNQGIFRMADGRFTYMSIGQFPVTSVKRIYDPGQRFLYLGSSNSGVYIHDARTDLWTNYRVPGQSGVNNIYALAKGPGGQLLVGTSSGLFVTDSQEETLKRFEKKGFEISRPVYFITKDRRNRFWFGTDKGAILWDGTLSRSYWALHGLAGMDTNRGTGIIDGTGKLWIGTDRGLSIYNEMFDEPLDSNPIPKLQLLSLDTGNRTYSFHNPGSPIQLDANTHSMVFSFRGVSFQDENSITFSYKLDGFDRQWSKESRLQNPTVRYSNLSPGTYRFQIKARNVMGVLSDTVTSPFIVLPNRYYQTWWFYLSLVLVVVLLLYIMIRFFTQRRNATLLESQVRERTGQLQAVEKRYRNLFEESGDAVFISTPGMVFMDINPAGVQLFGFRSKEEMLTGNGEITFVNEPDDRRAFREAIEEKGVIKEYETLFKRKDGTSIHVRVTAAIVRDNTGRSTAYRGIIRDISDQKRLEEQLLQAQKMEAIGTLAGGIAHDFNNILGVIVGYTDMLMEDLRDQPPLQRNALHVLTAANRASELVKQILAFSRQSKRERTPLKISAIINETLNLLRSSLPANIEILCRADTETRMVMADPTQMHQVLMNLCTNAAHAMKENGGVLSVQLEEVYLDDPANSGLSDAAPGHYARLTVKDTGHGIPKIVRKRMFEPYFTTKDTGEGTGMGLAVIHGIIKSHDGDISVESEPGKGSSFHVFLPQIKESQPLETDSGSPDDVPTGTENILVIDDQVVLIQVVQQVLERLGYRVTCKTNPVEALEAFCSEPDRFDLVITDLTMPQMTGLQVAKTVKGIKPGIPVILCSGFSDAISREEIKTTIDDFIKKPIIKANLARSIRRLLDRVEK
ncbi:MAG: response regulator [bacterium]|nr:response regulator [bacterium]